jgi:23S rRNA (uridine2552-2'-O)-methyltransferase
MTLCESRPKDGYRARAAYKLKEIDESLKLIQPGHTVVDLGLRAGAWSQYVRRRSRPGAAWASSTASSRWTCCPWSPSRACIHPGRLREEAVLAQLEGPGRAVDVVVSDMAPNLSGHGTTDGRALRC